MPDRRHYLRPIPELRAEADEIRVELSELLGEAEEQSEAPGAVVTLCGEILDELESWRALLGQQLTIEPCGIASVMVGPEGQVRLQVERKPLRDGGVPAEGMAAAYEATAAERRERLAEAEAENGMLRAALIEAKAELVRWGWGDFHYGDQPQEQRVVDAVAAIDRALE